MSDICALNDASSEDGGKSLENTPNPKNCILPEGRHDVH